MIAIALDFQCALLIQGMITMYRPGFSGIEYGLRERAQRIPAGHSRREASGVNPSARGNVENTPPPPDFVFLTVKRFFGFARIANQHSPKGFPGASRGPCETIRARRFLGRGGASFYFSFEAAMIHYLRQ
ncbi:MAG: hypothetical protein LBE85_13655 [Candidatus Accumulibacter sp.]|nr:hypothetical protein [Accumulibacter sp.]